MSVGCKTLLVVPQRKGSGRIGKYLEATFTPCKPFGRPTEGFMQGTVFRLMIGVGMMLLALLFTGLLAMALEKFALSQQHIDESYIPPKVKRF